MHLMSGSINGELSERPHSHLPELPSRSSGSRSRPTPPGLGHGPFVVGAAHCVEADATLSSVGKRHRLRLSPTDAATVVICELRLTERAKNRTPCLTYHWCVHYYVEAMWHEDHRSLAFVLRLVCS